VKNPAAPQKPLHVAQVVATTTDPSLRPKRPPLRMTTFLFLRHQDDNISFSQ
jgi:hypothetical protein